MKKLISTVIAFALSVSALVPVFAADTFKDVNSKSYEWAYSYVEDMAERGLIKGYEDGTFRPGNSVSRMDAFALFSRLMGSNSEVNADALAQAKETYAEVLAKYELSYAEGDVAFMLSRGVLLESELDTYFEGKKKSEAMPRYEAAILITKAMLGEQEAKNEVLVDMDYTDVSQIPKAAKQYVYFVTQKEIMKGMGENEFSPNTDVLRGQIAVMLSKVSDATNYTFEGVTIDSVDAASKNITIKDDTNKAFTIGYSDDARFLKNGEAISASQLKSGQKAVLTYVSDGIGTKLAFADIVTGAVEETKAVIFTSYTSASGSLILNVTDPTDDAPQSYSLSGSAAITADGNAIGLNSLKKGDYITIGLSGDVVVEIKAMQKSTKVEGVIEKIGLMGNITISSDNKEFDGITLPITENTTFAKNGDTATFAELGRGDKVTLTLEYGRITRVAATSATKTVTGVLKAYTISDSPTITINRDGTNYTFDVPATAVIMLNSETATLQSFNIGSTVTVVAESDVVKKVTASDTTGALTGSQVTGVVVGAYGNTISIKNTDNGGDITITVTTTNTTKVITLPSLAEYSVKKIKSGDSIIAYGAYSNGIFVASGITVTPTAE